MKVLIAFSGGKDSQACLLWAAERYGIKNITSVFCDTGWESPKTYEHIEYVINDIGCQHVVVKSCKYDGFVDMSMKKKRFPSTNARFCTEELKSKPMIDFVLSLDDNVLIIQGIRSQESPNRKLMESQCRFFKYYFEPYGYDKKSKPKYHTYRKKDIKTFTEQYTDDILRPVFDWSGQEVINYIIANGQKPNPLYKEGFSRVGCFPCIMYRHGEIKQLINRYPEQIQKMKDCEAKLGRSFFPPDYIPSQFCSGESDGKKFPWVSDVEKYVKNKNLTKDMFNESMSCMSLYGLCE